MVSSKVMVAALMVLLVTVQLMETEAVDCSAMRHRHNLYATKIISMFNGYPGSVRHQFFKGWSRIAVPITYSHTPCYSTLNSISRSWPVIIQITKLYQKTFFTSHSSRALQCPFAAKNVANSTTLGSIR
ncbi:unnamed protein product [Acanthoscelides obtectus]|uniref:Uncharacterized protein n=1 Tax=Acanthoscelides obtectus TaxID=200917 RepID=A0A9P0P9Q6_ACAOB|nr:unnamed protein product [Acanthoscelides obtectus]CAK1646817.1 hypothetical protein AOBTE_LOCUS14871 [Acanthoscelides obtectus]